MNGRRSSKSTGIGLAIGVSIGVAIGVAIDNFGAGIAIGVAIGAALGSTGAFESKSGEPEPEGPGPAEPGEPATSVVDTGHDDSEATDREAP